MGLNIAPRNHREAALSIGLALFVILELTIFIGVLNNTAMDLLVKPVAAILHVIRTQAGKVMAALDKDDVSHRSPLFCRHPCLLLHQRPSCTFLRCRPATAVMRRMGAVVSCQSRLIFWIRVLLVMHCPLLSVFLPVQLCKRPALLVLTRCKLWA